MPTIGSQDQNLVNKSRFPPKRISGKYSLDLYLKQIYSRNRKKEETPEKGVKTKNNSILNGFPLKLLRL